MSVFHMIVVWLRGLVRDRTDSATENLALLQQLAAFGHNLQARDPTLHVSALNLTNRHPDNPTYGADLAVSYLVYSPRAATAWTTGVR